MHALIPRVREYTDFHLFAGIGGGALGFARAHARLGYTDARFRTVGAVDVNPEACADYQRLTGHRATCLDLFTWSQYVDFHGEAPPDGWREATPQDIRDAAGGEFPDVVFTSPPCKGFSGLLNQANARTRKYQALNRLTIRSMELILDAFADAPPRLILMENVPRIATRGANLLDAIKALLESRGYAVAFNPVYNCGELGGLGQNRQRFLLVARHRERVPSLLYRPDTQRLRSVGDVIGGLPMPGDPAGGPMHQLPRIQWRTAVRLALIEAGGDWRDLNRLDVVDGYVQGLGLVEVNDRAQLAAIADHRFPDWRNDDTGRIHAFGQYGVRAWGDVASTVTAKAAPGSGPHNIADPRLNCDVNDRQGRRFNNVYRVTRWDRAGGAVTSASGNAAPAIADPRVSCKREGGSYASARHYGVVAWNGQADAVIASACHDNGRFSVADRRVVHAPGHRPDQVPVIISLDGTWHRPFSTLELAALQGFPVLPEDGEAMILEGRAQARWRERIGNAVPPPAAQAVAATMLTTLLLADAGDTVELRDVPVWVRPLASALSMEIPAA